MFAETVLLSVFLGIILLLHLVLYCHQHLVSFIVLSVCGMRPLNINSLNLKCDVYYVVLNLCFLYLQLNHRDAAETATRRN